MAYRPAPPAFAISLAFLFSCAVAGVFAQAATQSTQSIAGIITSLSASTLTLQKPDGSTEIADLSTGTIYLKVVPDRLESVKAGDALGVGARIAPGDALVATEVTIFAPALWDRVRKGQFPMRAGGIMTNAQVNQIVQGVDGRVLHMQISGGTDQITVPVGTPIRRIVAVDPSTLQLGERILVRGAPNPDGSIQADSVSIAPSA